MTEFLHSPIQLSPNTTHPSYYQFWLAGSGLSYPFHSSYHILQGPRWQLPEIVLLHDQQCGVGVSFVAGRLHDPGAGSLVDGSLSLHEAERFDNLWGHHRRNGMASCSLFERMPRMV